MITPESQLSVSRRSQAFEDPPTQIERHKTAIRRKDFSLAVKCLLRDGLLPPGAHVLRLRVWVRRGYRSAAARRGRCERMGPGIPVALTVTTRPKS